VAKKKTEWAEMVGYGKWLEVFLAPKIENWDVKNIFRDAIDTLGLEYHFSDDHILFKKLEIITNKQLNWMECEGVDALCHKQYKNINQPGEFHIALLSILRLPKIIRSLERLFKEFIKSDKPWNMVYAELVENTTEELYAANSMEKEIEIIGKGDVHHHDGSPLSPEQEKKEHMSRVTLHFTTGAVDELFGKICETIVITCDGYKKIKTIITCKKDKIIPVYHAENNEILFLDVIAVRIFFEFLFLGGQDYYGFCEYCGNFFVAERKGRKKFCSDVCRTMNQRK
jgi:hypothetical protein